MIAAKSDCNYAQALLEQLGNKEINENHCRAGMQISSVKGTLLQSIVKMCVITAVVGDADILHADVWKMTDFFCFSLTDVWQ